MRWSIRYRLILPLGLLLLGVVATSTWSAVLAARHADEQIARRVRGVIDTMAGANYPLTPNVLEQMKGLSGAEYYLVGPDGSRASTFSDLDAVGSPDRLFESGEKLPDQLGPSVELNGRGYRCQRLVLHKPPNDGATLFLFYPEALRNQALWDAVRPSLVLGLFGGMAALAVAIGIGQRLVRRIRALERRTRQIASGDFAPMPLPRANDELRDLSQSVNEMAGRLALLHETVQRTERLRLAGQLAGGLAHQLRNGLTGARLAVQVLAGEYRLEGTEPVEVVLRQLALLEVNVRRFIDLGRTEGGKRERCSLTRLTDEAVGLLRPQSVHAHTRLVWEPPDDPAEVDGDAGQLRDLLVNVINNAIEAAGPEGTVEVGISPDKGGHSGVPRAQHVVAVWDTGDGPPTAIAGRLFDAFVTGKPDGIGLGLAVARQAAEAHGGRVEWFRDRGRTCFRIELPAAER